MTRLALVAAAAVLLATACSESPCQELGERLCRCTGLGSEECKRQVESQIDSLDPDGATEDRCSELLGTCNAPEGGDLCEFLLTEAGKRACGVAAVPEEAP